MAARRARIVIAAAVVAALAVPVAAGAAGPDRVLPAAANGERAIAALGDRLPEVAAAHDRTAAQLRQDLRSDAALWVDVTGRLYYVDAVRPSGPSPAEATTVTDAATTPSPDEAFALHSRPGASRVIYLDFDGHTIENTAWNGAYGSPAGAWWAEAYDTDRSPGSFSTAEREVVVSVWQRVAEDFAPFDVDVTTADPGDAAITRNGSSDGSFGTRVLVSSTSTIYSDCGCGGVAYVGTYDRTSSHAYYQPAWVFTLGVGTGPHNIAEAASHEAGHNLGLSHDGHGDKGYYTGHEGWAPIMGVGYHQPITQWSRGEYSGATQTQDDLYVMTTNGAPWVADDHGSTPTPLAATAPGVISSRTDTDTFAFTLDVPATATITVAPSVTSPNLDARLEVRGGGLVLGSDDPASSTTGGDVATGMGAQLVLTLDPGTYTAVVDGVGRGTASTGYTDYGSLGRYTISLATTPVDVTPDPDGGGDTTPSDPEPDEPLAAPTSVTAVSTASGVALTWSGGSGAVTHEVLRETQHPKRLTWSGLTTVATGIDGTATSYTDASATGGTYRYAVVASDGMQRVTSPWSDAVTVGTSGGTDGGSGGGKGGPKKATTTQRIP